MQAKAQNAYRARDSPALNVGSQSLTCNPYSLPPNRMLPSFPRQSSNREGTTREEAVVSDHVLNNCTLVNATLDVLDHLGPDDNFPIPELLLCKNCDANVIQKFDGKESVGFTLNPSSE